MKRFIEDIISCNIKTIMFILVEIKILFVFKEFIIYDIIFFHNKLSFITKKIKNLYNMILLEYG